MMSDINNINKSKKRIKWLDFAKGVTILSVVLVHSINYIKMFPTFVQIFIYTFFTFVMPVFFAISGFLYRPANTWKKYKTLLYKKCTSFIIPYAIFTYIYLFSRDVRHPLQIFMQNGLKIFYLPTAYLWFLYALFFIFIIVGTMDLFHINFYLQCLIATALLMISCIHTWNGTYQNNGINLYCGMRICGYIACFYIGMIIKKYKLVNILKHKWFTFTSLIIWIILLRIQHGINNGANGMDTNDFAYFDIITKILSIFVFLSIFINFNRNNFIFRYFDKYGKYTLLIYLTHIPFMTLAGKLFGKISLFNTYNFVDFPIIFLLVWFGSTFVCNLALKYKIINFIYYPRKYINKLLLR